MLLQIGYLKSSLIGASKGVENFYDEVFEIAGRDPNLLWLKSLCYFKPIRDQWQKNKHTHKLGDWLSFGRPLHLSIAEFLVHFLREKIFTGDFWHLWRLHKPGIGPYLLPRSIKPMWDFLWYELRSTGNGHPCIILWSCHATYKWGHGHPINAISYQQKIITAWVTLQVQEVPIPKESWNCPTFNIPNQHPGVDFPHLWGCQVLPLLIEVRFLHSIFCMAMALDGASQPLAY